MNESLSQEDMEKLQEVAKLFRKTAEEMGYKKIAILWSVAGENGDKKFATGVTLSDDLKNTELSEMSFRLIGRAYNMIDWD